MKFDWECELMLFEPGTRNLFATPARTSQHLWYLNSVCSADISPASLLRLCLRLLADES